MSWFQTWRQSVDWVLVAAIVPLLVFSLTTLNSFTGDTPFFLRQVIWVLVSLGLFFGISMIDMSFLKRTQVIVVLYGIGITLLLLLFVFGDTVNGARSWFNLGAFSLQPSDPMKIILILILAKYFSRRHIAIKDLKHIFISGLYFLVPFGLIFLQPDFGSAIIFFAIWFGMVLVAGISKKHLFGLLGIFIVIASIFWVFIFEPYQKDRIMTFVNPLSDIQGAGYNAYQSTVAVGSGQWVGKGVGYGTQSRLEFLPEHETDFIFASFAEEWGFIGALVVLALFGIILWRILKMATHGSSNFEMLFGIGVAIYIMAHITVNIGMNIGLLPVTGVTLPFLSYGGSHMMTTFLALGILVSMSRYRRRIHRDDARREFVGYASEYDH